MAGSTITYTGDPQLLQKGANDTASCLGELESQLRALSNVQDLLQAAVQSDHTGQKIYSALGNAWTQGKSLAGTLEQISEGLARSGVQVDAEDLQGAAKIAAQQATGDGSGADLGNWSGKINTADLNSLT
ncbi:hypothetical protein ABIA39_006256 [Nocardia sp. GAS34]|uniref:hypothetical protein n=1 Tax=unclassified Nocardia TaxID=2637762 RepID=UPI003D25314F